jgi:hypothetical protein
MEIELPTNIEISDFLKHNVNWTKFIKLVRSLGNQLNDQQWRFLKAFVFEKSVELFSNSGIKYVGVDGCDFLLTFDRFTDIKLEMKFAAGSVYGRRGKMKKRCVPKLMNSNGTNIHQELPANYADFLIMVSENGAALVDKPTLSKYCKISGDGISADIPMTECVTIFRTLDLNIGETEAINIREAVEETITKIIKQIN